MGNLIIWGALALLVAFVVFLGYRRSKTGYLIFIVVIGIVGLFATQSVQFINGSLIGRKYTELTGQSVQIDPLGPFTSALDRVGASTQYLQFSLIALLVGVFFIGRCLKFISKVLGFAKRPESLKKRRKRILKNFGLKSMNDIEKFQ